MSDPAQTVTPIHEALALIDKWAKSDAPPEIRDDGGVVISARELARLAEIIASFAPKPLLPSPSEREELASVISHAINFDDGAHHLSMGDDGEPCRACQDVADAVLAKGYSKRSSPSSSEPASDATGTDWTYNAEVLEARAALMRQLPQYRDSHGDGPMNDPYVHAKLDALCAMVWRLAAPASPSSAGQEVRELEREALLRAEQYLYACDCDVGGKFISNFRDRDYPALSAGETERLPYSGSDIEDMQVNDH